MDQHHPAAAVAAPTPTPRAHKPPDPCAIVFFGASGDLISRLVMPALYNLARTGTLPENLVLIGIARHLNSVAEWRDQLHTALQSFVGNAASTFNIDHIDKKIWQDLAARMVYLQGDLTAPDLYARLAETLADAEREHATQGNAIFYLAIAPAQFATVIGQLGAARLTEQPTRTDGSPQYWRRVVIEKPFGNSLESARALETDIHRSLQEEHIYRIDHFLGKDAVRNIMAFRFANGLFEPSWNRDRIDHVQITVAETIGVGTRGAFYESTGALRDMVPNHVLSLLAMVAMEPPAGFSANAIHTRKAELMSAVQTVMPAHAVRGQYGAGTVRGKDVPAYRAEPAVAADSQVETYAAMRFDIDNWRWAGVPFYVRTGKHLACRLTEIAISFKQAPYAAFRDTPVTALRPNWLVLRIAPDESISLQFEVNQRGTAAELAAVRMDFRYDDWFPKAPNVGFETLLHDVMVGDSAAFMCAGMVDEAWRIVQPVLDDWQTAGARTPIYNSGGDGPAEAKALFGDNLHRGWRALCPDGK
jgi:glucose-6-phosphate 1-dehydrogenase